jgi:hypothetical protein
MELRSAPRVLSLALMVGWAMVVGWVVAACSSSGPTHVSSPSAVASPGSIAPTVGQSSGTPSEATVSTAPLGDVPPAARLAAEGGDPVEAQLGTYTWRDSGSDSPWLPGARIAVGAGEPLSVSLDPPVGIAAWQARYVSASADGPAGATSLGEGSGAPSLSAPGGAGAWTVEVHAEFGDGLGNASYFWRLEIGR